MQGYTESEISRFLIEADPEASGRVALPSFLTAAPSIFSGLTDYSRPELVSSLSPAENAGWSSQVNEQMLRTWICTTRMVSDLFLVAPFKCHLHLTDEQHRRSRG
jgi:hypothetical protein